MSYFLALFIHVTVGYWFGYRRARLTFEKRGSQPPQEPQVRMT